jgi:hypothetical protein
MSGGSLIALSLSSGTIPRLERKIKSVSSLPLEKMASHDMRKSDPSRSSGCSPLISPSSSLSSSPLRSSPLASPKRDNDHTFVAPAPVAATSVLSPTLSQRPLGPATLQRQESRELSGSRGSISGLFPNRALAKVEEAGVGRLGRKGSVSAVTDEPTKHRMEGDNMLKKKRAVEAFEHYNRSLALDPDNPVTLVSRAVAHLKVPFFFFGLCSL